MPLAPGAPKQGEATDAAADDPMAAAEDAAEGAADDNPRKTEPAVDIEHVVVEEEEMAED